MSAKRPAMMERLYKITRADGTTRGDVQWGRNVTRRVVWKGKMCAAGCLHAYRSLELAVLMDAIHGDYLHNGGCIWEARGRVLKSDGLKVGCDRLTTIRKILKAELDGLKVTWNQERGVAYAAVRYALTHPSTRMLARCPDFADLVAPVLSIMKPRYALCPARSLRVRIERAKDRLGRPGRHGVRYFGAVEWNLYALLGDLATYSGLSILHRVAAGAPSSWARPDFEALLKAEKERGG